jgi:serine/threonine-protein kinase HipA
MTSVAEVKLWGRTIGAVSMAKDAGTAAFEYDPAFAGSGMEISPLVMPLSDKVYTFPELSRRTFHGLPGLLADSLPDRFGNALINAWLAFRGRQPDSFNGVERLCYMGIQSRGNLDRRSPDDHERQAGQLYPGRFQGLRQDRLDEARPSRGYYRGRTGESSPLA